MKHTNILKYYYLIVAVGLTLTFFRVTVSAQVYRPPIATTYPKTDLLSSFRLVKHIFLERFTIPTVIEFPLTNQEISQQPYVVYDVAANKNVHYLIKTIKGKPPITITREGLEADVTQLHDQDMNTFFEAPLAGSSSQTVFFYRSSVPLISSSLKVSLSPNGYEPDDVTIYNFAGVGRLNVVAYHVPFNNGKILFPQNNSENWQILFTHRQPLRIAELEFVPDNMIEPEYSVLRFLAEPDKQYRLYLAQDRYVPAPYTEMVNLEDPVDNLHRISSPRTDPNPLYTKADTDADGVIDELDNCPSVANPDQKNVNGNNFGDACEDFDRDGIMNYRDNCPNNPNASQIDADSDGYGDICDPEESRLTERIWWLPWLGIVVGFGAVLFIFKTTVQAKKKE